MGGGKAGSVARSRALNFTLIVMYKGKVRRTWRTTGFIHVNISVRRYFSSFGHTPSSGMKAAQSFIHEAPAVLKRHPFISYSFVTMVKTNELPEDIIRAIISIPPKGIRPSPKTLVSLFQQCVMLLRSLPSMELSGTSLDVGGKRKIDERSL